MSFRYLIEVDRGNFTADYEWRALVYKDGQVVNCFLGDSAALVSDEANVAVHWHESREPAALHSVKA